MAQTTQTPPTPPTPAAPATKYFVKCDECRETMRFTDSMQESAKGGRCEKCRAEISEAMRRGFAAVDREIAAYDADIYKAKRNARVAKKGGLR